MKKIDIGLGLVEKKSLYEVFQKKYTVPFFQRAYTWGKDHWSDLYSDVTNSKNKNREHFFGFMTFKKGDGDSCAIIEGQQRLTTVTIFLGVIRDIALEIGATETANDIQKEYIQKTKKLKGQPYSILEPSKINKKFFKDYIQEPGNFLDKKKKSKHACDKDNKPIWSCYEYFYNKLSDDLKGLELTKKDAALAHYANALIENFIVVIAYVEDPIAAYNIFQTINDRGQDLALSDILKMHLLQCIEEGSKKEKESEEFINEYWDDAVRAKLEKSNLNNFVRHHWLSRNGVVSQTELLDVIRSHVTTLEEAYDYVESLSDEVSSYEALLYPTLDGWSNWSKSSEIVDSLLDLGVLSPTIPITLLMAAASVFRDQQEDELINTIKHCTNFLFRYLTIAEKESKELEKLFSELAINLRKKKITTAQQIREELIKNDIKHDEFRIALIHKDIKQQSVAKYMLKKIEIQMDPLYEKFSQKITLEHILPQKPDNEWNNYLVENNISHADYVHKLGNLTLLLGKINSQAQNKFITKKVPYYKQSSKLKLNDDLQTLVSWNDTDFDKRHNKLINLCEKIWVL